MPPRDASDPTKKVSAVTTQGIISLKERAIKVPGKPRRVQLDFVRGVAVLMVMAGHFHEPQTGVWILDEFTDLVGLFGGRA